MFHPEMLGVMIPIIALIIPIVAILTKHQQKMAEIIHNGQQPQLVSSDVESLRVEIQALKEIVHQQAIAMDGRSSYSSPPISTPPPVPDVARRLIES